MGITFAYELGLKSFIYEKSSTRKVTSETEARTDAFSVSGYIRESTD